MITYTMVYNGKEQVATYLDQDDYYKLKSICDAEKRSISYVVKRMILKDLENYG